VPYDTCCQENSESSPLLAGTLSLTLQRRPGGGRRGGMLIIFSVVRYAMSVFFSRCLQIIGLLARSIHQGPHCQPLPTRRKCRCCWISTGAHGLKVHWWLLYQCYFVPFFFHSLFCCASIGDYAKLKAYILKWKFDVDSLTSLVPRLAEVRLTNFLHIPFLLLNNNVLPFASDFAYSVLTGVWHHCNSYTHWYNANVLGIANNISYRRKFSYILQEQKVFQRLMPEGPILKSLLQSNP